ncbi:tetratricopeptide repeat protein [Chryseolinea soli]|uniref:Tetratricopeptide repeat protein n=1 Tax=Chryseolinea soli TaxID=2321403 RepID=A0A385STA6_9BACT|nr:tetratricopeptide repeat protein [Chryseolinea soli]AYB32920.1 tetratricopeptide repeat protein [Chryseolinea soli]
MKKRFEFANSASLKPFLLAIALLVSVVARAQQDPEVTKALRLIELDKQGAAVASLQKAVSTSATPAVLYYYLGYAQIKNGEREKAKETFTKGIGADEKQPLNYVGKGLIALQEKQATDAKALFDKALTMTKSKDAVVLRAVAEAYLGSSQTAKEAMPLLEKAKKLDETSSETEVLIGDAFLAVNNGGSAVSAYERAAKLDPKSAKPHYKIGLVYLRSQNVPVAEEAFNKAISIDPDYALAYKELGELYYLAKDGPKAVKAYEKYLEHTEKADAAQLRYAFFLFMAKDFAKANTIFAKLVEKPDATPTTVKYYAYSQFEAKELEKSQQTFEKYFAMPNVKAEASDFAYFGNLLMELKKDSLAVLNFTKSLELEPKQMEIRQKQSDLLMKNKKYADAVPALKALMGLRAKPLSADYYNIGRAYYFTDQFPQADTAFTKLIEMQPNMTIGYLWEGRTKANLDPETETGLAKPYYESLIEKSIATPDKSKKDLIEAYSYLGYYYFLKADRKQARTFFDKVLALDPNDQKALTAIEELKKQP